MLLTSIQLGHALGCAMDAAFLYHQLEKYKLGKTGQEAAYFIESLLMIEKTIPVPDFVLLFGYFDSDRLYPEMNESLKTLIETYNENITIPALIQAINVPAKPSTLIWYEMLLARVLQRPHSSAILLKVITSVTPDQRKATLQIIKGIPNNFRERIEPFFDTDLDSQQLHKRLRQLVAEFLSTVDRETPIIKQRRIEMSIQELLLEVEQLNDADKWQLVKHLLHSLETAPSASDWQQRLQSTYGILEDDPIERPPQLPLTTHESIE